jgi:hypothetical protein
VHSHAGARRSSSEKKNRPHHPRILQTSQPERTPMNISIAHLQPIVSLIAGVLILMMPRLLNYIVAFFLIVSGILGLGLVH